MQRRPPKQIPAFFSVLPVITVSLALWWSCTILGPPCPGCLTGCQSLPHPLLNPPSVRPQARSPCLSVRIPHKQGRLLPAAVVKLEKNRSTPCPAVGAREIDSRLHEHHERLPLMAQARVDPASHSGIPPQSPALRSIDEAGGAGRSRFASETGLPTASSMRQPQAFVLGVPRGPEDLVGLKTSEVGSRCAVFPTHRAVAPSSVLRMVLAVGGQQGRQA